MQASGKLFPADLCRARTGERAEALPRRSALLKWDGTQWQAATSPTSTRLSGLWGSTVSDVWAVGNGGTIAHWDGTNWSLVASGTTSDLVAISGLAANNIWAATSDGQTVHWDGTRWTPQQTGALSLHSAWTVPPANLYLVGDQGTILHRIN